MREIMLVQCILFHIFEIIAMCKTNKQFLKEKDLLLTKGDSLVEISKKEYSELTKAKSPDSTLAVNCLWAFFIGGLICVIGQALTELYKAFGQTEQEAATWTSVTLVFVGVLLTALDVYGKIAKKAGAGTLVPITGFANSVASPAIEFKSEGFILGLGAKLFTIAGPVIVYGTLAGVIYGVILAATGG